MQMVSYFILSNFEAHRKVQFYQNKTTLMLTATCSCIFLFAFSMVKLCVIATLDVKT